MEGISQPGKDGIVRLIGGGYGKSYVQTELISQPGEPIIFNVTLSGYCQNVSQSIPGTPYGQPQPNFNHVNPPPLPPVQGNEQIGSHTNNNTGAFGWILPYNLTENIKPSNGWNNQPQPAYNPYWNGPIAYPPLPQG